MTALRVAVRDGTALAVERRGDTGGRRVVLLHAGVADSCSWAAVLDALEPDGLDLVAIDRRGFGESPDAAPGAAFTHLDDLVDVLDGLEVGPAVLVGSSTGGGLALDLALTEPDRVHGLLLIGSAVSGMTDEGESIAWTPDAATGRLLEAMEAAEASGDLDGQVRLELHAWLDGPTQREGRVGGAARELAAAMSRRALQGGGSTGASGIDAWHRLAEVDVPGIAAWGDLDMPPDQPFYELAAARLPRIQARVLPGVAHLPSLEDPALVAALVREVVALADAR
ncbi:alpha/beta fold hydrolase [Amnibacterium endophyticum]|uniref:Alpha/beta fold hydrolase n=1 Tax=Amnibacterium endophyticum TaxID=2109337 RepID=A0ABW4LGL1_9MICO